MVKIRITEIMNTYFGHSAGEVIGIGTYKEPQNTKHPLGGGVSFYEVIFAGALVEVDKETGFVHVKKLVTVGDIGKAINPLLVESQDEGGAIQGVGHSLMEHLVLDERGRILNLGALDYRIPTTMDIPDQLVSMLVENMDGSGPMGLKEREGGIILLLLLLPWQSVKLLVSFSRFPPITPEYLWCTLKNNKSK